jgi:hypothetical protein
VTEQGLLLKGEDTEALFNYQNFNLQQLFQVGYILEFGEHNTKQPHTKFQTQILMYGKAAAL